MHFTADHLLMLISHSFIYIYLYIYILHHIATFEVVSSPIACSNIYYYVFLIKQSIITYVSSYTYLMSSFHSSTSIISTLALTNQPVHSYITIVFAYYHCSQIHITIKFHICSTFTIYELLTVTIVYQQTENSLNSY